MTQSTSFLELPPEIRNMCYSYMTPINGRPKEYAGLFLSCKQVNSEINDECAKYMHHYIDALEAEWTEFESKRQGLHVYRVELPQITRPHTFAEMQHLTLTFPRQSDEHTPTIGDLFDNLEPHLRQIVQLHLESLILECLDYTSRSMDQPWQIGSVYIPLLCQTLEQEKARLRTGDKVGVRIVIVKLAQALTAWEASMVRNFAKYADPKIVSRMEVLPDMKGMLVEILYGSIWGHCLF